MSDRFIPSNRVIMVCGHAKLKQGTTTSQTSSVCVAALQVDTVHGVIISCNSSLTLEIAKQFPENLVVGYSLLEDMEELARLIESRYIGLTTAAFIAAIQDARRQFIHWKQDGNTRESQWEV